MIRMNTYLISGSTYSHRNDKALEIIGQNIDFKENHPDIKKIEVEEGKKNISIDQIREVIEDIFIKPVISDKKIVYIEEAHLMTIEAQNSILKTLEEPPAYAVFILSVTSRKNVLETISSRCSWIDLKPTPRSDFSSAEHNSIAEDFIKAIKLDIGARIDWISTLKDKIKDDKYFSLLVDSIESILRDILIVKNPSDKLEILNVFLINTFKQLNDGFR